MKLLNDKEIRKLLDCSNPVIENFKKPDNWFSKDSLVQPSSLDLHIGGIYIPDDKNPIVKGEKYSFQPGTTVVVETNEIINLPGNISAFGFPPNQISADGILMINPGHIDPGYYGKMSFTLINMSKKSFELKKGGLIVSLLLVELSEKCEMDYSARRIEDNQKVVKSSKNKQENQKLPKQLELLTYDFLNVERRAKKIANKRVGIITAFGAILVAIMPLIFNLVMGVNTKVNDLEGRLKIIENQKSVDSLNILIKEMQVEIDSLQIKR